MPKNDRRVYTCMDCGGDACYVTNASVGPPPTPRCENCKRLRRNAERKVASRQKTLGKNEADMLNSRRYVKKHAPMDLTGKLPTTWFDTKENKRLLIRGLPTGLLSILVIRSNMIDKTVLAMVKELRTRPDVSSYVVAKMNRIDPQPCRCGKPGIYIVGRDTYCYAHKPNAVARLGVWRRRQDQRSAAFERAQAEADKQTDTRWRLKVKHRA